MLIDNIIQHALSWGNKKLKFLPEKGRKYGCGSENESQPVLTVALQTSCKNFAGKIQK